MPLEEKQNQENITEENPVSTKPKREVVESIPVVEEIPAITEVVTDGQVASIEEVKNQTEQVEISEAEVVEPIVEEVAVSEVVEITENEQNDAGLPHSSAVAPELAKTTEEIPAQPQIKTIEKIVYQIPPNFIQNLLNKARAKIQERKRKKLNKILLLFETKSQITNSDIQKLLRVSRATSKRYMDILEKENKVIQIGSVGKGVFYTKKQ